VGVGSGDGRGLTQVWGSPIKGTWEQAMADRRTFCATTGAGYVRHSAGYVKSYRRALGCVAGPVPLGRWRGSWWLWARRRTGG